MQLQVHAITMAQAKAGDTVKVHYTGTLNSGRVFDSSKSREPLEFTLGSGMVIPGFDQAVTGLSPGESVTATTRKRIRVPAVFGRPWIAALYGRLKATQAALLRDRLQDAFAADPSLAALVYNGSLYPESVLADVAAALGRPRVFVEAGFFPGTLQLDPKGLNAANSVPRDPAFYLQTEEDFAADGLPTLVNTRKTQTERRDRRPAAPLRLRRLPGAQRHAGHASLPLDPQHGKFPRRDPRRRRAAPRDDLRHQGTPQLPPLRPGQPAAAPAGDLCQPQRDARHDRGRAGRGDAELHCRAGGAAAGPAGDRAGRRLLRHPRPRPARARHAAQLDTALSQIDTWHPDPRLRRQVLGWLWNHYLTRGSYADPPPDLPGKLDQIVRQR